jgi:hypothetical protein
MGEKRNAYRILVGKPEGKWPLGRPNCRWVDNIKIERRYNSQNLHGATSENTVFIIVTVLKTSNLTQN